jgi:HAD superfamily hydrolase (TIGR01509 family)
VKGPKAILFDFDGVIVDSEAVHHRAYELALAPFGVERIPFEIYAEHWSNLGEGLAYAERTWPGVKASELKRRKEELFVELLESAAALRPGAEEAVIALAARWPAALATGSVRAAALHVLERFALRPRFRAVVAREDYERDKPAPDAFLRAAERLGVAPAGCIVIEDSMKGLAAAIAAGIPCIVVPNDYTRAGRFDGAVARLGSMRELTPEVVERAFAAKVRSA